MAGSSFCGLGAELKRGVREQLPMAQTLRRLLAVAAVLLLATCHNEGPHAPVASLAVAPQTLTVGVGATAQLTATPRDANGAFLAGRSVTWASSNTAVATVNTTGLVTGVAAGQATITATSEGRSGTAVITVSLRATSDRADEVSGNQIHVLYVLPSDGTDRGLDIDGTLQNTVGSFQIWLAGQTA